MGITISQGLQDLSTELGESTVNTTTKRVTLYNEAIEDFFSKRKFPFAIKKDSTLSTSDGVQTYTIPAAVKAIWRSPGAIKEIAIGDDGARILPMDWEDRHDSRFTSRNYFYVDPEETEITFKKGITSTGEDINIFYWHIPARITDIALTTEFPLPERYRKVVAICAAAFVQWSRYLEAVGNRLYKLYERKVRETSAQQSETHRFKPRKLQHFLQYRGGFRRR